MINQNSERSFGFTHETDLTISLVNWFMYLNNRDICYRQNGKTVHMPHPFLHVISQKYISLSIGTAECDLLLQNPTFYCRIRPLNLFLCIVETFIIYYKNNMIEHEKSTGRSRCLLVKSFTLHGKHYGKIVFFI